VNMEIATSPSPKTLSVRFLVVASIAVVAVVGLAFFAFNAPADSTTEVPYGSSNRRTACSSSDLLIKSASSGYYLAAGTINGNGLTFTDTYKNSATSLIQWNLITASSLSGNTSYSGYYYIKAQANQLYLSASSGSDSGLVMKSGTPGASESWKLTLKTSGSGCGTAEYYIQPKSYSTKYLEGGVYYPGLATSEAAKSARKFYVQTTGGVTPCGVAAPTCVDKICKTGISVPWHASNCTTSSCQSTETSSMNTCNTHCMTCQSWDSQCKPCGGTIDSTNTFPQTNGTTGGDTTYWRQCDCNSGFKTAGISLAAMFVVAFTLMKLE